MNLKIRYLLSFLSFVIPTLVIGFEYKYGIFKEEYERLQMYREDISMPFAFASLFIQAGFWAYIGGKLYINDKYWIKTLKLFAIMFSVGLSFGVFVIGAKHTISSLANFAFLETGFTFIMYLVVCPLITLSFHTSKR